MQDQILEQVNTAREALRHLSEIQEVDIATAPKEVVWEDGKVKLFRFTADTPAKAKTPILVVYALVNRWEMMDLQPDLSFIRKLVEEGMEVYIIDWGYASRLDRYKTLEDYILGHVNDCVDYICTTHQVKKINLLGVCQGGTFSLVYAALFPEKIKNIVTTVTPVDFSADKGLLFNWASEIDADALVEGYGGVVPGEFLNVGFDLLKPLSKTRKYLNLPKVAEKRESLLNFLRMEKWVTDSPDQAGEAYRCFVKDFYQKNKLIKGELELGGRRVDLKKITMPMLTVYAKDDHIVPPSSTVPVHDAVGSKDKELMEFPGGHIGVFVGGRSQKLLTPAIAKWLLNRDA